MKCPKCGGHIPDLYPPKNPPYRVCPWCHKRVECRPEVEKPIYEVGLTTQERLKRIKEVSK